MSHLRTGRWVYVRKGTVSDIYLGAEADSRSVGMQAPVGKCDDPEQLLDGASTKGIANRIVDPRARSLDLRVTTADSLGRSISGY